PCAYLDEMQDALQKEFGLETSTTTLLAVVRALDYTNKHVSKCALERDDSQCAVFWYVIGKIAPDPNMLVFLDEASKNEKTPGQLKGWLLRGTRVYQRWCFIHGKWYSILPAITLNGIVAREIVDGLVTTKQFCDFLRYYVIPLTNPYPGPRSCIVLDNCSIHHSEEVRKIIEDEAECKMIFLPSYSPDYNPIKLAFSAIKAYLCCHYEDSCLMTIHDACDSIGPWKALEWFRICGYYS
ncbi:hypothetical protein HETIRDRAFT_326088, partial [Heterobasidion irregulare TC 32-1]